MGLKNTDDQNLGGGGAACIAPVDSLHIWLMDDSYNELYKGRHSKLNGKDFDIKADGVN